MRSGRRLDWRALTMVGALLAIWLVFSIATDGTFLRPRNLSLLARQMSVTSILAVGMVLVIVAGQIDLSVGALAGLTGALGTLAYVRLGWPLALAFLAALGIGAALGALQGSLVARLRIPPFIVTLGGMLLFQGALLGVTGGVSISPPRSFLFVGQAYLPRPAGWILAGLAALALFLDAFRAEGGHLRRAGFAALAVGVVAVMNAYAGVPVPVLVVLTLAAALSTVALHTPFGRHLYAIGGNREAAFYSGIAIERHLVGVFTLMGLLAGAAGVVLTARVGSATPNAGQLMELDAIAAAVIGGTSLLGGQGTVWGALLGALVMASLDNGMSLLNTESFWQLILKGAILVAAVAVDMAGRRGR
ncbi:MAG TPA: sugar ABC transporter permease [Thermoanaerobaculia bacterium]|jgi:D-xylose transport system permease protein|nr:sugar ABC transporter permease [Thermoanaerobaculia bacterium]